MQVQRPFQRLETTRAGLVAELRDQITAHGDDLDLFGHGSLYQRLVDWVPLIYVNFLLTLGFGAGLDLSLGIGGSATQANYVNAPAGSGYGDVRTLTITY